MRESDQLECLMLLLLRVLAREEDFTGLFQALTSTSLAQEKKIRREK